MIKFLQSDIQVVLLISLLYKQYYSFPSCTSSITYQLPGDRHLQSLESHRLYDLSPYSLTYKQYYSFPSCTSSITHFPTVQVVLLISLLYKQYYSFPSCTSSITHFPPVQVVLLISYLGIDIYSLQKVTGCMIKVHTV